MLDRLLHHCEVINIKGESYRLKDRRKQGASINLNVAQTIEQGGVDERVQID
jgi:hypothetical protein